MASFTNPYLYLSNPNQPSLPTPKRTMRLMGSADRKTAKVASYSLQSSCVPEKFSLVDYSLKSTGPSNPQQIAPSHPFPIEIKNEDFPSLSIPGSRPCDLERDRIFFNFIHYGLIDPIGWSLKNDFTMPSLKETTTRTITEVLGRKNNRKFTFHAEKKKKFLEYVEHPSYGLRGKCKNPLEEEWLNQFLQLGFLQAEDRVHKYTFCEKDFLAVFNHLNCIIELIGGDARDCLYDWMEELIKNLIPSVSIESLIPEEKLRQMRSIRNLQDDSDKRLIAPSLPFEHIKDLMDHAISYIAVQMFPVLIPDQEKRLFDRKSSQGQYFWSLFVSFVKNCAVENFAKVNPALFGLITVGGALKPLDYVFLGREQKVRQTVFDKDALKILLTSLINGRPDPIIPIADVTTTPTQAVFDILTNSLHISRFTNITPMFLARGLRHQVQGFAYRDNTESVLLWYTMHHVPEDQKLEDFLLQLAKSSQVLSLNDVTKKIQQAGYEIFRKDDSQFVEEIYKAILNDFEGHGKNDYALLKGSFIRFFTLCIEQECSESLIQSFMNRLIQDKDTVRLLKEDAKDPVLNILFDGLFEGTDQFQRLIDHFEILSFISLHTNAADDALYFTRNGLQPSLEYRRFHSIQKTISLKNAFSNLLGAGKYPIDEMRRLHEILGPKELFASKDSRRIGSQVLLQDEELKEFGRQFLNSSHTHLQQMGFHLLLIAGGDLKELLSDMASLIESYSSFVARKAFINRTIAAVPALSISEAALEKITNTNTLFASIQQVLLLEMAVKDVPTVLSAFEKMKDGKEKENLGIQLLELWQNSHPEQALQIFLFCQEKHLLEAIKENDFYTKLESALIKKTSFIPLLKKSLLMMIGNHGLQVKILNYDFLLDLIENMGAEEVYKNSAFLSNACKHIKVQQQDKIQQLASKWLQELKRQPKYNNSFKEHFYTLLSPADRETYDFSSFERSLDKQKTSAAVKRLLERLRSPQGNTDQTKQAIEKFLNSKKESTLNIEDLQAIHNLLNASSLPIDPLPKAEYLFVFSKKASALGNVKGNPYNLFFFTLMQSESFDLKDFEEFHRLLISELNLKIKGNQPWEDKPEILKKLLQTYVEKNADSLAFELLSKAKPSEAITPFIMDFCLNVLKNTSHVEHSKNVEKISDLLLLLQLFKAKTLNPSNVEIQLETYFSLVRALWDFDFTKSHNWLNIIIQLMQKTSFTSHCQVIFDLIGNISLNFFKEKKELLRELKKVPGVNIPRLGMAFSNYFETTQDGTVFETEKEYFKVASRGRFATQVGKYIRERALTDPGAAFSLLQFYDSLPLEIWFNVYQQMKIYHPLTTISAWNQWKKQQENLPIAMYEASSLAGLTLFASIAIADNEELLSFICSWDDIQNYPVFDSAVKRLIDMYFLFFGITKVKKEGKPFDIIQNKIKPILFSNETSWYVKQFSLKDYVNYEESSIGVKIPLHCLIHFEKFAITHLEMSLLKILMVECFDNDCWGFIIRHIAQKFLGNHTQPPYLTEDQPGFKEIIQASFSLVIKNRTSIQEENSIPQSFWKQLDWSELIKTFRGDIKKNLGNVIYEFPGVLFDIFSKCPFHQDLSEKDINNLKTYLEEILPWQLKTNYIWLLPSRFYLILEKASKMLPISESTKATIEFCVSASSLHEKLQKPSRSLAHTEEYMNSVTGFLFSTTEKEGFLSNIARKLWRAILADIQKGIFTNQKSLRNVLIRLIYLSKYETWTAEDISEMQKNTPIQEEPQEGSLEEKLTICFGQTKHPDHWNKKEFCFSNILKNMTLNQFHILLPLMSMICEFPPENNFIGRYLDGFMLYIFENIPIDRTIPKNSLQLLVQTWNQYFHVKLHCDYDGFLSDLEHKSKIMISYQELFCSEDPILWRKNQLLTGLDKKHYASPKGRKDLEEIVLGFSKEKFSNVFIVLKYMNTFSEMFKSFPDLSRSPSKKMIDIYAHFITRSLQDWDMRIEKKCLYSKVADYLNDLLISEDLKNGLWKNYFQSLIEKLKELIDQRNYNDALETLSMDLPNLVKRFQNKIFKNMKSGREVILLVEQFQQLFTTIQNSTSDSHHVNSHNEEYKNPKGCSNE